MKKLLRALRATESQMPAMYNAWSFFSALPVLETPRLRLRLPTQADAPAMFEYCRDPEVARTVLWSAHTSLSDTRSLIRAMQQNARDGRPVSWGIEWKETGRIIGTIGLMWWNDDYRSCEVGYSLSRAFWGRGIASEALRAVVDCAFESLPLNRLEAQHQVDNPASGAVMRHAGMTQEGLLRQRLYNKGRYVDVYLYSLLRSEWAQRKAPPTPDR